MELEALDRHDLKNLEDEFIQLAIADLTDDVNCDINDNHARDIRLDEIACLVGEYMVKEWFDVARERAKEIGYASGMKYGEDDD